MKDRFVGKGLICFAATLAAVSCLGLPLGAQELSKLSAVRARAGDRAALVAQGLPGGVVIVATNSVNVKKDAAIPNGTIVVNNVSPGPFLDAGVHISIEQLSSVGLNLIAPSIELARNATVGAVCVDAPFKVGSGATFTSQGPYSTSGAAPCDATPPIFDLPAFQTRPPGAANLNVASGATLTIPNANDPSRLFNNVTVGSGATLILTGGEYAFASVALGQDAKMLFQSAADVRISGRFDAGKRSIIGPAAGSGITAADIIFYVAGANGGDGTPNALPQAAQVGSGSTTQANFYVPNGTLRIEKSDAQAPTSWTGAAIARDVRIDNAVSVFVASFFANKPPIANPQTVFTNGAASTEIILTGSDPEGGSLIFSIPSLGGPNESIGTLSGITPIIPAGGMRCSITTTTSCTVNADCPFGETCESAGGGAAITSARVTYTAVNPAADEENQFTFQVADPQGLTGAAVVSINPDDPSPPAPPPTAVTAPDISAETTTNAALTIALSAGACPGSTLEFEILTLPANGSLSDNGTAIESTLFTLSGSSVIFTPAADFNGSTTFNYRATDTEAACTTTSDDGTVTVNVSPAVELAPDQTVTTTQNKPVQVTLLANPGGTGTPIGQLNVARSAAGLPTVNAPLPGATIAGNVSDANGDGLGDGKDNLPGSGPVFISAGIDINLGNATVDLFSDLASWQAAAGGGNSTQDFSGFAPGASVEGATILPGVVLSSNFDNFTVFVTSPDNAVFGFDGTTRAAGDGYYQLDFSQTYNAVSFVVESWDPAAGGPAVVEVTLSNGTVVSHNVSKTTGTESDPVFIGLRSPNFPITRVRFNEPPETGGSGNEETVLDDIKVANNATGIHGIVRTQIEWDVSTLPSNADEIESCQVTLTTHKGGSFDNLDTAFFAGAANQNGTLDLADFQAPTNASPLVVMQPSAGTDFTDVPFSFDVTSAVKAARSTGITFFSIQGRVDEDLADGNPDPLQRGLQIRSTASGNLAAGTEPKLSCVTSGAPGTPQLTWTIETLPSAGTLLAPSGSSAFVGQTFTTQPTMTFISPVAGTFSFQYSIINGVFDEAIVTLLVNEGDDCVFNGRPAGCLSGGQ